jgi:hypothetical protein
MPENNQSVEVKTKNITLGLVVSWAFSVLVGLSGLGLLFSEPISGILFLLIAIITFPPANRYIEKKYGLKISTGVKILLVVTLLIISGLADYKSAKSEPGVNSATTTSSQANNDTLSNLNKPTSKKTVVSEPAKVPVIPKTIFSINGSGTKSTQSFSVPSDWSISWSYDCSNMGDRGNFQVYIYNSDGSTSNNLGINQLGKSGADTDYYHNAGKYYLFVNTGCVWNLKVED